MSLGREAARTVTAHVAGMGAVTGFGVGRRALTDAIFAGHSALRFDGTSTIARFPTEVHPADATATPLRRLAVLAAEEALKESAVLRGRPLDRRSLALIVASTKGELDGIDPAAPASRPPGLGNVGRFADRLADALGISTPPIAISCACASGVAAIAHGARAIARGHCERVLIVAADEVTEFVRRGFVALLALDPERCRPFDRSRTGLNLGEATGALVLTRHAEESTGGAIVGWGASNDANHLTGPSRDGAGLALAARRAVRHVVERGEDDGLTGVGDLDFVHLHGTGTPYNDATEALAMASLFAGRTPPAAGTKAQTGHTLGAAGLLETLIAIAALERAASPPNVGLNATDVAAALDITPESRPLERAEYALKVSAGFGGINSALVIRRSNRGDA